MKATLWSLLALSAHAVSAQQVSGTPSGFAKGTTGGGTAKAQTPSSLEECVYPIFNNLRLFADPSDRLKSWITDDTARTILIDRTWDFTGTEGTTDGKCCSTSTTTCEGGSSAGQASIQDSCDDGTWVDCTYDDAAKTPLDVGSNKSIVGVGSKGVLKGKGLRVSEGNKNVIIQNIHITVCRAATGIYMCKDQLIRVGLEPTICLGRRCNYPGRCR